MREGLTLRADADPLASKAAQLVFQFIESLPELFRVTVLLHHRLEPCLGFLAPFERLVRRDLGGTRRAVLAAQQAGRGVLNAAQVNHVRIAQRIGKSAGLASMCPAIPHIREGRGEGFIAALVLAGTELPLLILQLVHVL